MGISIEQYRRQIGSHYGKCVSRAITCKAKLSEEWKPPTELPFDQPCEARAGRPVSLPPRSRKAVVLLLAAYMSVILVCTLKPPLDKNLHDLSSRMLLAGDISENPGPVAGFGYAQPVEPFPNLFYGSAMPNEENNTSYHAAYSYDLSSWTILYVPTLSIFWIRVFSFATSTLQAIAISGMCSCVNKTVEDT